VSTPALQNYEVRSHVLALREGELDSRLRDRDRTIEALQVQLNALTGTDKNERRAFLHSRSPRMLRARAQDTDM
jgi:hypothetical protein